MTSERLDLGGQLVDRVNEASSYARVACDFLLAGQTDLALKMAQDYRASMEQAAEITEQIRARVCPNLDDSADPADLDDSDMPDDTCHCGHPDCGAC